MSKHTLREEAVITGSDGQPVYGYRVAKTLMPAFAAKVRELTAGQCLMACKEEGDQVSVVVMLIGDKPNTGFHEALSRMADLNQVEANRLASAAGEANTVAFDKRPRP